MFAIDFRHLPMVFHPQIPYTSLWGSQVDRNSPMAGALSPTLNRDDPAIWDQYNAEIKRHGDGGETGDGAGEHLTKKTWTITGGDLAPGVFFRKIAEFLMVHGTHFNLFYEMVYG